MNVYRMQEQRDFAAAEEARLRGHLDEDIPVPGFSGEEESDTMRENIPYDTSVSMHDAGIPVIGAEDHGDQGAEYASVVCCQASATDHYSRLGVEPPRFAEISGREELIVAKSISEELLGTWVYSPVLPLAPFRAIWS